MQTIKVKAAGPQGYCRHSNKTKHGLIQCPNPKTHGDYCEKHQLKHFAITGEYHGSIVEAENVTMAVEIFQRHYCGEVVINRKILTGPICNY